MLDSGAEVSIAGRPIGKGRPPFVIAEMSANHNGDFDRAIAIIDAAKETGASAVKLQTYTANTVTLDCDRSEFKIEDGLWEGHSLYELYSRACTPWEWHAPLFAHARELGLPIFSSAFDPSAVDLLESLGTPAYKVASFEAIDLPLIRTIAATGKPMIISTGIADLREIEDAVAVARSGGARELCLLHCVSGYPTPPGDSNLQTLVDLATRFDAPVGLSDHSRGTAVAVAAVALGACLVEKHLTLRKGDDSPDAAFSLDPTEFARLVEETRIAWEARGGVDYQLKSSEVSNIQFRRSIYAVCAISEGEAFTSDNVRSIRPGHGLAPKFLPTVIGREASRDIERGEPLDWSMVAG